jgi:hypothetical protein
MVRNSTGFYEIRDPIHGFIEISEWEREIIYHYVFQRLRRIRQLGWTDMVYPGAMHTRFEHSLGVMYVATRMFDQIVKRREKYLRNVLKYKKDELQRDRVILRLASLLHDVGHSPFSHAGEGLMLKKKGTNQSYKHENYSAAAVRYLMGDVIENSKFNKYGITANDISDFLDNRALLGRNLIWRNLLSSQLDADRADYLLRDSHHIGVAYGQYDLNRIFYTVTLADHPETGDPCIAIDEDGLHAAEGLIVARYMMFTQVYFQHTRRAYDYHIREALQNMLLVTQRSNRRIREDERRSFPPPTSKRNIVSYLQWNDWKVLGLLEEGAGGEHGEILRNRNHYRKIYETPEYPSKDDIKLFEEAKEKLGDKVRFVDLARQSWYSFDKDIILHININDPNGRSEYLSKVSSVANGLKAVNQLRIYVSNEEKEASKRLL